MKKLIIPSILLLLSCGGMNNIPSCPPPTGPIIIHDSVLVALPPITVTDTVASTVTITDTVKKYIPVNIDSNTHQILIAESPTGDNAPQLQAAVNYVQNHPGRRIRLTGIDYPINWPIIVYKNGLSDYAQSDVYIEGNTSGKTCPSGWTATIRPQFTDKPAIIIQQGKSCYISKLIIQGLYTRPRALNQMQVDTLSTEEWADGVATTGPTNPYCAIAIDPFSDSNSFGGAYQMYAGLHKYYKPGMSRSGSTDIHITDCGISGFVVGVMCSPSRQQNCDEMVFDNDRIDYCRSAFAFTQAQQKENMVTNYMCWGHVRTIFDGSMQYGIPQGDGVTMPMVDYANLANDIHEILSVKFTIFPITMKRIYGELIYTIGNVDGGAGIHFEDFQIDFQNGIPGVPSPPYYYWGTSTVWSDCQLRLYNGIGTQRIVLNSPDNSFTGGCMSNPPFCAPTNNVDGHAYDVPIFKNIKMFYKGDKLNNNTFDSVGPWTVTDIHINADRTGWYVSRGGAEIGDLILAGNILMPDPIVNVRAAFMGAGFCTDVKDDTVLLSNIAQGLNDGDTIPLYPAKIKNTN